MENVLKLIQKGTAQVAEAGRKAEAASRESSRKKKPRIGSLMKYRKSWRKCLLTRDGFSWNAMKI